VASVDGGIPHARLLLGGVSHQACVISSARIRAFAPEGSDQRFVFN
jgi:hypothetical protein